MARKRTKTSWNALNHKIVDCRQCDRLIRHCESTAIKKRKSYQDDEYWGKPVPNLGEPDGRLLIVGLAPAAHGANRTGRMFTGDRSGDFLFDAMFRTGFCNQPNATDLSDGLQLFDCAITAVCHCAPPQNKPEPEEVKNCSGWLESTLSDFNFKVLLALGSIAWDNVLRFGKPRNWYQGKKPKFGHGESVRFDNGLVMLGSFHPSQQNTFTGRLTKPMLVSVFKKAAQLIEAS